MNSQSLNENISRIKSVMGILNEQEAQFHPATALIRKGYKGPGTDTNSLVKGFQLIKSQADYKKVESEIAQYGGYKTLLDVLNGELGDFDLAASQQIQTALKAAGYNLQFKTFGKGNAATVSEFTIGGAVAATATAQPQTTNGWWDAYPALVNFLKDTTYLKKIYYPKAENKDIGSIVAERTEGGSFYGFFKGNKFYIFDNLQNALGGVSWKFNGTWKESGGKLYLSTNDGETFNSSTKTWTKSKPKTQWTKETGKFPLMYGQFGPTIKTLQLALGLKGDTYFGAVTEKYIKSKAPEYKRETGVTDDIYNKIVNAAKPAAPAQPAATQPATPPPPTEAELQANPSTLNPY